MSFRFVTCRGLAHDPYGCLQKRRWIVQGVIGISLVVLARDATPVVLQAQRLLCVCADPSYTGCCLFGEAPQISEWHPIIHKIVIGHVCLVLPRRQPSFDISMHLQHRQLLGNPFPSHTTQTTIRAQPLSAARVIWPSQSCTPAAHTTHPPHVQTAV